MSLELTLRAAAHVSKHGGYLRITVKSGGCSGFRYLFALEDKPSPTDYTFSCHGVTVITDPLSLNFIDGGMIDYHEEMLSSHFVLQNPKATTSCGCGDSFSVF